MLLQGITKYFRLSIANITIANITITNITIANITIANITIANITIANITIANITIAGWQTKYCNNFNSVQCFSFFCEWFVCEVSFWINEYATV